MTKQLCTWTTAQARMARSRITDQDPSALPDGWIVLMGGADERPVAAGPSAREALRLARQLGFGEGRRWVPASAAELDALDLPPSALGIAPGADPWWHAHWEPPAPERIDVDPERPVYRPLPGARAQPGATVHAWGPSVDGARAYLGCGELMGMLRRERTYVVDGYGGVAHYCVSGVDVPAADHADVALPIVADSDRRYLPAYPNCPDCGGEVEWAEAGRVPGSRECAQCGSTFADTQYSMSFSDTRPAMDGIAHVDGTAHDMPAEAQGTA